jgi:hypothetical protein
LAKGQRLVADIWKAAWDGDDAAVCDLVARGVGPDEREPSTGCSPLHYAATTGSLSTIRYLLGQAVDVNGRNRMGRTPLHLVAISAASRPSDDANLAEAQELLLAAGADPEARDGLDRTPASYARTPTEEGSAALPPPPPTMCYIVP